MLHIYNRNFPTVGHNLGDFVDRANGLYTASRDFRFANFVLTGEFDNQRGQRSQAFIDPILNATNDGSERLTLKRDYDSLLGIARDILVQSDIQVFTIPRPEFALKSSLHIKFSFVHNYEDHIIDFYNIPNFQFGSFGDRGRLYIFFPSLWTPERAKGKEPYLLSAKERALWYEKVFRPSIVRVQGQQRASEWPETMEAVGHSHSTKIVSKDDIWRLNSELPINAAGTLDTWTNDFFFLHTVRCMKHSTVHRAEDIQSKFELGNFLRQYKISPLVWRMGHWYIDVGLEISSDVGSCLQWRTATHAEVVRKALRISPDKAARLTSLGSSKYSRDYASHLTAVSGFRIVPGARTTGEFDAKYIQAYTTDRFVLDNPELRHHGKFLTLMEAMGSTQPIPTIHDLHTIYESARENNPSKARLEVCVPLNFATRVLLEFDPETLQRSLFSFSREDWWNFRITRLIAIAQVLHAQANGIPEFRIAPDALSLTAACVWLLNGLHARPEDGIASRRLMDAALPVQEVDVHYDDPDDPAVPVLAYRRTDLPLIMRRHPTTGEEEEEHEPPVESEEGWDKVIIHRGTPIIENGCIFFRPIHFRELPRFEIGGSTLPALVFRFFFQMSPEELEYRIVKPAVIDWKELGAQRRMAKKRKLCDYIVDDYEQLPPLFNTRFCTAGSTMALLPPVEIGSDNVILPVDEDEDFYRRLIVNQQINVVYGQFLKDVLGKSPDLQGAINLSYLQLDNRSCIANARVFTSLQLSSIFNAVAYKNGTIDEWQTSFDSLFPRRGEKPTIKSKGYSSSIYYLNWIRWANDDRIDDELVDFARDVLWDMIQEFQWIPHAQEENLWPTSARDGFTRWPEAPDAIIVDKSAPASRILLKRKVVPIFGGNDGEAQDTGEEE